MPQPLGSKERTLFAQVVKNYENKQYKKGLKAAEQILRKNPNHGDTQAMKALIINIQGNSEEAFALAKVALKSDMKSHVCWHVYGLLYRSAKNFEEAIKAYKFALKLEPESQQIQRDLALLQIQMRDYDGYVQSRRAMLGARSALRSNWTALAIAQHLAGDLVDAERTLTTYEETLKNPPPKTDSEHAETVLYKNTIIAEMGEAERALEHLDAVSKGNTDRTNIMEMRAKYLLKLGRMEEAEKAYRALLDRNAEYRIYYEGLQAAVGLDTNDAEAVKKLFGEYVVKNPRGDAARRIPLEYLKDEDFRLAVDEYLQRMLHKGVPSTFANIKALYLDVEKRETIQRLAESYVSGTHKPQANGPTEKQVNGNTSPFESSALFFLAQHYNYHLSRDLTKAMDNIDKALELDPKSVDFTMTKARIYKHYGDLVKASETMENARLLDIRDRYINTRAAKYQLRNDENEAALKTMSMFTRNEAVGGPLGDLHDMQCIWYLTEDGESFLRQKKLGFALKRFTSIYNIFEVWQEDQFDFHRFSLQKAQIRPYVEMIRWEDHLREHPFYTRAALSAIKSYLLLHDKPHLAHGPLTNGVNGANGDSNMMERRKAMKRARKAQEKQDQIDAEKNDAKKTAGLAVTSDTVKGDADPSGEKLLQTSEPLKEAMKFLTLVLESSPNNIRAQNLGFEVFLRRKKYLLAFRCLLAAHVISSSDPQVHYNLVRFQKTISSLPSPLPSKTSEVITSELTPLFPSPNPDLRKFNEDFLIAHENSLPCTYAGLRARQYLDATTMKQNQKDLLAILDKPNLSLEDTTAGLDLMREWEGDAGAYMAAAQKLWPQATAFRTNKESI